MKSPSLGPLTLTFCLLGCATIVDDGIDGDGSGGNVSADGGSDGDTGGSDSGGSGGDDPGSGGDSSGGSSSGGSESGSGGEESSGGSPAGGSSSGGGDGSGGMSSGGSPSGGSDGSGGEDGSGGAPSTCEAIDCEGTTFPAPTSDMCFEFETGAFGGWQISSGTGCDVVFDGSPSTTAGESQFGAGTHTLEVSGCTSPYVSWNCWY